MQTHNIKDYVFLALLAAGITFFIIKELRNNSIELNMRSANKELQLQYDSISVKIGDLEKLIKQLDSVKTVNNNYYTEVIKESDEIIKADSNSVNGLIRKQCSILSGN